MVAADNRWTVDVPFDARLFLEVPAAVRTREDPDVTAWAQDRIGESTVAEQWRDDHGGLRERLEGQARLLSDNAFAAFLFCPRGLPGDALVEVFITDTDAADLEGIDATMLVALPQRTRPINSEMLGEGREIASVAAGENGAVIGQLRYQFVSSGVFVDVAVTSTDLGMLGAGGELFEQLVTGISVRESNGAEVR